ncbi:hypothetical protein Fmac_006295 [Flemingia macrophylla]|uniref:Uncharacterized protein n=1 Tax=Flemingia macrophylla TaxID=520843 RepID=A0ABD1NAA0_9FABA
MQEKENNSHCSTGCFSYNKMEAHSGLNTLECLRGRLLAERKASRVAKQQAEAMGNQFVELENKIKEEIKLRNKAERKLKALKKKLERFNVSSPSSGQSHSSEKCESSCGTSLCSTASGDSEANETKLHAEKPALLESEVHNHNDGEEHALFQTHNSPFTAKDCGSKLNDASHCNSDPSNFFPQIPGKTRNQSLDNLKNDENRCPV